MTWRDIRILKMDAIDYGYIGVFIDWYNGFRDWPSPPYGKETVIVLWNNGKIDYTKKRLLELVK